jgi:hypothetical protein
MDHILVTFLPAEKLIPVVLLASNIFIIYEHQMGVGQVQTRPDDHVGLKGDIFQMLVLYPGA